MRPNRLSLLLTLPLALLACDGGGLPEGWAATPDGDGPRIVWDLNADPLPDLPLPNDVATWPDRTARTGRRINVSIVAPTQFERHTREQFDLVDGWGTYAALSIPFEEHIDLQNMMDRQGGSSEAFRAERFADHAVYLVNLETGEPMPLDVNSGNFQFVLDRTNMYFPNDPRHTESNLFFETVDEDVNDNGVLDPGEDTDFDGILDAPNTFTGEPGDVDDMVWFYERETKTLLLKPILPLEPKTTYAVVVTDRLIGENGAPVRSPFDTVHHVAQRDALEPLPQHFADHPTLYGDLATRGWDGVAFAWTFTTQSVTDDIDAIRNGLYGEGPFADLAEQFPPDYAPATMREGNCEFTEQEAIVAPADLFVPVLKMLLNLAFSIEGDAADAALESFEHLSHVVVLNFDSPYFLGDPHTVGREDNFVVDSHNGTARVGRETLSMSIFVPKETAQAQQPFDTAFYVHGYGSANAEPLPFLGYMLQNGVSAVLLNAEGHGVPLEPSLLGLIRPIFDQQCLGATVDGIIAGRAEDHDGDNIPDSGVDFWTAYVFHTRDVVRQSVVDYIRAIQLLGTFDGREANEAHFPDSPVSALQAGDAENPGAHYTGDIFDYAGNDIAGDFDGDGTPDVGGPDNQVFFTGGSLGGIVSGIVAGAEPNVRSSAPIVGAGGLTDVGSRTENGGVLRAMHLRLMGPLVLTTPASERGDDRTSCAEDEVSMYFYATERNTRVESEFACLPADIVNEDDVIVVGNFINGERRCSGASGGQAGRFQVPFPADPGDSIYVEIHPGRALEVDYEDCTFEGGRGDDVRVIDTFEVGADDCRDCAKYQQLEWQRGERLVSPAMGFGHRRQSSNLRRLMFLAQVGLEPADPINYARRVFLQPLDQPVNLLVANSIGDQNVPLSAGNAYARAAGLLPFLPPDAPEHLADWRAPASFEQEYPGYASPNDLLIGLHVLEGVDRLERHPMADGPADFLIDVDDLAEGAYRFDPNGRHQSLEDDAVGYPRLDNPLRWVRRSRSVASGEDVWNPVVGGDISGLLNHYVIPAGVHGFDEIVYDPNLPWDPAQYLINLVSRYGATGGQDIRYFTDPDGHTCLEDSSCEFLRRVE